MLRAGTRIAYGVGGGVFAIKEAAYAIFILLFYTQVLGLSGSLTGIVIALSLLWDGISDPLVGSWSDRLRSRYGRRHPFMVYSTLPLAIGFVGLFSPPETFIDSQYQLAGWLLFWSLWVRTFITTFSIPHLALSAELSSDYNERSQLLGARLGVMFMVTLFLPAAGLVFIFPTEQGVDGRFVVANYPWYGLLSACLAIALAALTILGTRRQTSKPDFGGEDYSLPGIRSFIDDVLRTFRNRAFRTMINYDIASAVSWGCVSALNVLIGTYVFEFDSERMALILAAPSLVAVVLVWITLKPLTRRWEKPQLLRLCTWGMLLNSAWLLPLKLAGLLPDNDSPVVLWLNLLNLTFFMFFFLLRVTNAMSIVADITDQHELEEGGRREGGFFSVTTFISKMASLVGPLYGGIVLDVIGLNQKDLPGDVAQPVLEGLMYASLLISLPTLSLALYFAYRIEFDREEVDEIQLRLREKESAGA